jgi:hypothetical protein
MARIRLNSGDQPTVVLNQGQCKVNLLVEAFGTGTAFMSNVMADLQAVDSSGNPLNGWTLDGGSKIIIYFQDYGAPLFARAGAGASGLQIEVQVIPSSGVGTSGS